MHNLGFMCISSYDEFLHVLSNNGDNRFRNFLAGNEEELLWFRGQASHKWDLLPSLYRVIEKKIGSKVWTNSHWSLLKKEEKNRLKMFRIRNHHLLFDDIPQNNYLWMCIMQHNQIKTRLLDWSERADVAFYFSLYFYFLELKKWKEIDYKDRNAKAYYNLGFPTVWVLLPKVLVSQKIKGLLRGWDANSIQDIYNVNDTKYDLLPPTPILAPYNNERIKVQSGTFVVFPKEKRTKMGTKIFPDSPYLNRLSNSENFLFKFIIVHPEKCKKTIRDIGLKLSLFYPELPVIDEDIEDDIDNYRTLI